MRKILFRGKRTINGDWVYGDFVHGNERKSLRDSIFVYDSETQSFNDYEINPSTLGQYTGLTDKNGKRIFEGDIMKQKDITHKGEIQIEGEKYLVTSSSGCWFGICKKTDYKRSIFLSELCNIGEVIGNVHDNPELLEK